MKFEVDSNELKEALESIQVKGKGTTANGFGNTNLGQFAKLILHDNVLEIWNGNTTFAVKVSLTVQGQENGSVCVDSSMLLPYLKSFGDITFSVGDFILVTDGNKNASIPIVVNHPDDDALQRIRGMMSQIAYEPVLRNLFKFGQGQFEGVATVSEGVLKSAIKNCELVKTGVYKFDFNGDILNISSRDSATNKYDENITPTFTMGEPATVEFSSPVYAFFKKDQLINIYLKDEFPILLVANDRMLLKAPTMT